jgi:hypothetical protein
MKSPKLNDKTKAIRSSMSAVNSRMAAAAAALRGYDCRYQYND